MPSYKRRYDLDLSTEIQQMHLRWAQRFAGGSIRAFFIPDAHCGREIVELVHRMDVSHESITIDRNWMYACWGFGDFYLDNRAHLYDYRTLYQNLENAMCSDEPFDVLVLPEVRGWGEWSEKTRQAILKRVERGAGLVLVKPYLGSDRDGSDLSSPELEALSPLLPEYNERFDDGAFVESDISLRRRSDWRPTHPHYITDSLPFELIPFDELAYLPYRTNGDVLIESDGGDPILAVKPHGSGRVVTAAWYPRNILPQHADLEKLQLFESIVVPGNSQSTTYNYLEYFYGLLFRSMVWAAGKEPQARIEKVEKRDGALRVLVDGRTPELGLSLRVVDDRDEIVHEAIEPDSDALPLPEWLEKGGGNWRADVFLRQNDSVVDWRTVSLKHPLKARIDSILLDGDQYAHGDTVTVCAQVAGSGCEVILKLADCFGRVAFEERSQAEPGEIRATYTIDDWPSIEIWPSAEVWCDGRRIQSMRGKPALVRPGKHRFLKDFEAFMSSGQRGHGDLWDLQRKRAWDMGITGAHPGTHRVWRNAGAEGFGVTFYGRKEYIEQRDKYVESHDKQYLVRRPCLNDPEYYQRNSESVRESLAESLKYMPVAYMANDEGSLTCYTDEVDFCFSSHCLSALRKWLVAKYGRLEALNDRWRQSYTEWEQVIPDTYLEAVDRNVFAAWGDHRLFMESTFAGAYQKLAQQIQESDPDGVIRMSGCQASTAYSGYDYYQLHQHIGYFEAYGVGNQYEFHRSFKRPGTVLGGWFGYGQKGDTVKHSLWHVFFHEMTLISVFWEISNLNPDFTLFGGSEDMGEVFKEFRRTGIGKLLLYNARRDNLGIAVHYSMPSIHASYADNNHVSYEENRQGWLDLLEDLGYQYDFVSSQQIEAGKLLKDGFRILILPFSRAISEKEEAEIREFASAGGVVVADYQCGIMDESCGRLPNGRLDDIFGLVRHSTIAQHFFCERGEKLTEDFPYFQLSEISSNTSYMMPMHEPHIRLAGGHAALTQSLSAALPSVVVNRRGKGFGVYLNSSMNHYVEERKGGGVSRSREVMGHVMQLNGLQKPAEVLDEVGMPVVEGLERIYYRHGERHYIGLLRNLGSDLEIAWDGRETGDRESSGQRVTYTIRLPEATHVYDVRAGSYLGFEQDVQIGLNPGSAAILAVLPYAPPNIELSGPDRIRPGDVVALSGAVKSDYEKMGSLVWNVQVYQPDGSYDVVLSDNHEGESLACRLQIPYNAREGQWRIVVRDVSTGAQAERLLEVVSDRS